MRLLGPWDLDPIAALFSSPEASANTLGCRFEVLADS